MRKTLFDESAQQELLDRLKRLTPDMRAKWGQFDAVRMLTHINDAVRMATGELPVKPKKTPLKNAFGRWFAIHSPIPWPKGAPTAPELLTRGKADGAQFEAERATFAVELRNVAARKGSDRWPEHPAFGQLTEKDWGVLGYRHVDHHFRQFGI